MINCAFRQVFFLLNMIIEYFVFSSGLNNAKRYSKDKY